MKAAFKNLLGNIAIGEDVTDELKQVGETVVTFLTGNLIPMIGNVLASIPDLLGKDFAAAGLNMIAENSDQILESGVSFVTSLVTGIITALPYLAEAALNLVASFANAILTMDWLLVAQNLITGLKTGLETAAVETLGTDTNIVDTIMTGISEKLPEFLNKGVEMVTKIANGILESLPQLITMAGEAIVSFVSGNAVDASDDNAKGSGAYFKSCQRYYNEFAADCISGRKCNYTICSSNREKPAVCITKRNRNHREISCGINTGNTEIDRTNTNDHNEHKK
mgnify:CR=1 FL=1